LSAEGNAQLLEQAIATCHDAYLEATDRHGQTPLNLAARHGHGDVVAVLLAAGATPDHADCDGWTALRAAAWGGHIQVREFSNSCILSTLKQMPGGRESAFDKICGQSRIFCRKMLLHIIVRVVKPRKL
jgi:hypothetical protein